jgi:hypothetical protein
VRTLRQAADALTDSAKKVRDTATSYTTTDNAQGVVFKSYENEL